MPLARIRRKNILPFNYRSRQAINQSLRTIRGRSAEEVYKGNEKEIVLEKIKGVRVWNQNQRSPTNIEGIGNKRLNVYSQDGIQNFKSLSSYQSYKKLKRGDERSFELITIKGK